MYQRILVPIDDSVTAQHGLAEAIQLAVDQHAQIRVVHVLSDAYLTAPLVNTLPADQAIQSLQRAAAVLLEHAAAAARTAGVGAETALIEHQRYQIGDAIVKEAEHWQADLIVMGTHGRRGLTRAVLGSDAEYVVRHTPVPVLLVRA
jgi:nucleotide-binding universal stress UspA family protein